MLPRLVGFGHLAPLLVVDEARVLIPATPRANEGDSPSDHEGHHFLPTFVGFTFPPFHHHVFVIVTTFFPN